MGIYSITKMFIENVADLDIFSALACPMLSA